MTLYFIVSSLLFGKHASNRTLGREPDTSVIPACLNVATVDVKINNDYLLSQVETFHLSHYKIVEPNRTQ